MPHTFTNLLTHVIFSTKDREPLIRADTKPRLYAYVGGIVRELGGTSLSINGVADHIHLLVSLPPSLSISDALRVIKANSSRWMHEINRKPFSWQNGYGAFSVSRSNISVVEKYIAQQEDHHRRVTFKEEYISFLKKHGIGFDERFIWA